MVTNDTLDLFVAQIGLQPVLEVARGGLTKETGRADMLGWLVKHVERAAGNKAENGEPVKLGALVSAVLACLLDRNAAVRNLAEQMLALAVASEGLPAVKECLSNFIRKSGVNATVGTQLIRTLETLKLSPQSGLRNPTHGGACTDHPTCARTHSVGKSQSCMF